MEAALEEGWTAEVRQPRVFRLSKEALQAVIELAGRSEQSDEEKQRLFCYHSTVCLIELSAKSFGIVSWEFFLRLNLSPPLDYPRTTTSTCSAILSTTSVLSQ